MAKTKNISFQKMERDVSEKLEWLWGQSTSDLGICSNFNVLLSFGSEKSKEYVDHFNEFILHTIARKRELEKTFFSLPEPNQSALFAYFGWKPISSFPPSIRNIFGDITPLVYYLHPNLSTLNAKENKSVWLVESRTLIRESIIIFYKTNIKQNNKGNKCLTK